MKIQHDIRQMFEDMLRDSNLSPEQVKARIYAKLRAESKPLYSKHLSASYMFVGCTCNGFDMGFPCYPNCEGRWEFVFYDYVEPINTPAPKPAKGPLTFWENQEYWGGWGGI